MIPTLTVSRDTAALGIAAAIMQIDVIHIFHTLREMQSPF